jgi:hypothetical protein
VSLKDNGGVGEDGMEGGMSRRNDGRGRAGSHTATVDS